MNPYLDDPEAPIPLNAFERFMEGVVAALFAALTVYLLY